MATDNEVYEWSQNMQAKMLHFFPNATKEDGAFIINKLNARNQPSVVWNGEGTTHISEILTWCGQQFGNTWIHTHYITDGYKFWFSTEEDATMFRLRWIT